MPTIKTILTTAVVVAVVLVLSKMVDEKRGAGKYIFNPNK
jgi:Na+-transporting NADH:ubiquinone oxidoreductase subunit NqrB